MKKRFLPAVLMAAAILVSGCGNAESGFDNPWQNGNSSADSSAASSAETTTAKTTTTKTTTTTQKTTTTASQTTSAPATSAEVTVTTTEATKQENTEPSSGSGKKISDLTPRFNDIEEVTVSSSLKGKYTKIDSIDYYYNNLDDFHKFIYMMIYDVCSHANVKDYKSYLKISEDLFEDFSDDFWMVFACVMDDNPEYYAFDEVPNISWSYAVDKNNSGYYRICAYQTKQYSGYDEELKKLDSAANTFLSSIDLSGSEYDVALRIHDKLIRSVTYQKEEESSNGISYSQTAYGALVNGRAVCEGIADAYSYLLRRRGIMCLPIEGGVGSGKTSDEAIEKASGGNAVHTWNLMRLDRKYYEADPTYDIFNSSKYTEYTLSLIQSISGLIEKREHLYWAVSLSDMRDLQKRDEFIYHTDPDGETFSLISEHVAHLRASDSRTYYYKDSGVYNYRAMSEMLPTQ